MADHIVVALIEDDQSVLDAIGCLLRAHGYCVEGYTSAEAFLSRGSKTELACLVLDIKLRGMSGIELQHHLRAGGSKLPIVIITADDDERTRRRTKDAGCTAYVRKPFLVEPLICAIRRATTQNS
jgi:FixJ family two-component response regulator